MGTTRDKGLDVSGSRDREWIRGLLYSYYTIDAGWGVHLIHKYPHRVVSIRSHRYATGLAVVAANIAQSTGM